MNELWTKGKIYQLLKDKGISYDVLEHDAVFTMEDMENLGLTEKGVVCKNLFLRDAKGKNHFLVCVPEEKKIDLKTFHDKIGSTKVSFASEERLQKYLGIRQGSVSPLGVLNDEERNVTVIFDKELQWQKEIGIHPNDNTATIWLSFEDLRHIIQEHGNEILLVGFEKSTK